MGDHVLLKEMGARISAKRKELKLTQEKLAELMDVSVQMISNLELGKKAIRPENLIKLSEVLHTSTDYLLSGQSTEKDVSKVFEKFKYLSSEDQSLVEAFIDRLL